MGRFIRFGVTAAPLEPDLDWTDADTGGTKVRDHSKVVGSCASAAMVGISYWDIYDLFLTLRRCVYRTHLAVAPCLSTSTICDWQAIGVRKYDPGGPARVRDLLIYLAGWAPYTYDLYRSIFSLGTRRMLDAYMSALRSKQWMVRSQPPLLMCGVTSVRFNTKVIEVCTTGIHAVASASPFRVARQEGVLG